MHKYTPTTKKLGILSLFPQSEFLNFIPSPSAEHLFPINPIDLPPSASFPQIITFLATNPSKISLLTQGFLISGQQIYDRFIHILLLFLLPSHPPQLSSMRLEQKTCWGIPFLSHPTANITIRSSPPFLLPVHPLIPASTTSRHSLETTPAELARKTSPQEGKIQHHTCQVQGALQKVLERKLQSQKVNYTPHSSLFWTGHS